MRIYRPDDSPLEQQINMIGRYTHELFVSFYVRGMVMQK